MFFGDFSHLEANLLPVMAKRILAFQILEKTIWKSEYTNVFDLHHFFWRLVNATLAGPGSFRDALLQSQSTAEVHDLSCPLAT